MITDEMIKEYRKTKNEDLFNKIYNDYIKLRTHILGPISNKNDLEEINSICDEVLLKCINYFDMDRKEAKFTTYLSNAILYTKWEYFKKIKKKTKEISFDLEFGEDDLRLDDILPDKNDYYRELEIKDFVQFHLSLLEEDERKLIEMIFFSSKNERNVAKYFGISQAAINKRKDEILHKMKRNIIIYNHK